MREREREREAELASNTKPKLLREAELASNTKPNLLIARDPCARQLEYLDKL
jgi:hypothetical protein